MKIWGQYLKIGYLACFHVIFNSPFIIIPLFPIPHYGASTTDATLLNIPRFQGPCYRIQRSSTITTKAHNWTVSWTSSQFHKHDILILTSMKYLHFGLLPSSRSQFHKLDILILIFTKYLCFGLFCCLFLWYFTNKMFTRFSFLACILYSQSIPTFIIVLPFIAKINFLDIQMAWTKKKIHLTLQCDLYINVFVYRSQILLDLGQY